MGLIVYSNKLQGLYITYFASPSSFSCMDWSEDFFPVCPIRSWREAQSIEGDRRADKQRKMLQAAVCEHCEKLAQYGAGRTKRWVILGVGAFIG